MDPWQCIAERNDAIRRWAELEGKSPLMGDDLYRRCVLTVKKRTDWMLAVGLLVRLAAWAIEVWWRTHG